MKNKFLLLFFSLSMLVSSCVFAQTYPKQCLKVTHKQTFGFNKYADINVGGYTIKSQKATTSQPILTGGLVEGAFINGQLQTGALLGIGAGWGINFSDITVLQDSSVIASANLGIAVTVIYGQSSLTNKQSFIPSFDLTYGDFIVGIGGDVLAKSNMVRLVMTGNLAGILPKAWTTITTTN